MPQSRRGCRHGSVQVVPVWELILAVPASPSRAIRLVEFPRVNSGVFVKIT